MFSWVVGACFADVHRRLGKGKYSRVGIQYNLAGSNPCIGRWVAAWKMRKSPPYQLIAFSCSMQWVLTHQVVVMKSVNPSCYQLLLSAANTWLQLSKRVSKWYWERSDAQVLPSTPFSRICWSWRTPKVAGKLLGMDCSGRMEPMGWRPVTSRKWTWFQGETTTPGKTPPWST